MQLSEISGYTFAGNDVPFRHFDDVSLALSEVASLVAHAREFVVHEASIPEKDMDTLAALLRGSLFMLRDLGAALDGLAETARGWTAVGAVDAPQGVSCGSGLPEAA